jgi:hypothetical protein
MIQEFISGPSPNLPGLAEYLDTLDPQARLEQLRRLNGREQARLFDAAHGFRPVRLADFVPANTPPHHEVIHNGRNSLPLLHFFQKRFCRPEEEQSNELWGYNEWRFRSLVGPGYFVARQVSEHEVVIDYCQVPPVTPASWPPIRPNSVGLSRFIFDQTQDFMRGVSRHVSVGRATRQGKNLDNWFVLCRSEP